MAQARRQIAYKAKINDILNGEYKKKEGWQPNYVLTEYGNISRVHILAVLVSKDEEQNRFVIEDGSGKITVRSFENKRFKVDVGDVVTVIGRPREWNSQKYLVPEIIKKIENRKWIEVRKIELEKRKKVEKKPIIKVEEETITSDVQRVIDAISSLDDGNGANYDDIIEKSKVRKGHKVINNLLEQGEIYELRPGKLKILE